jgi:hypothetical protein
MITASSFLNAVKYSLDIDMDNSGGFIEENKS